MSFFSELVKGILIGTAAVLPGVSGGTLALSMGVYDRIVSSVSRLPQTPGQSLRALLPYGIGGILGVVIFTFAAGHFLENWPLQTAMVFIGLILSGVLPVAEILDGKRLTGGAAAVFTAVVLLVLSAALIPYFYGGNHGEGLSFPPESGAVISGSFSALSLKTILLLFLLGFLSAAAMVIPGVSGSMLLMMAGCYGTLISAVRSFLAAFIGPEPHRLAAPCLILIPFGAGFVTGVFFWARLAEFLLNRFSTVSYLAVLGLILSSPAAILSEIEPYRFTPVNLASCLFLAAAALLFCSLGQLSQNHGSKH